MHLHDHTEVAGPLVVQTEVLAEGLRAEHLETLQKIGTMRN